MTTLAKRILETEPVAVRVTRDALSVDLADGRTVSAPLQWFPRIFHGTPQEWANYELMFDGIHWPDLNEDISVEGLLCGYKSGESPKSLQRWLAYRARGESEPIPELPLPADIRRELEEIGVLKPRRKPTGKGRRKGG